MSSKHTLPVNIFNLEGGETMLARYKGNFHAPGENRNRDPASFCQQVDDWTHVYIQKKKKPGLSADRPSNNCAQWNIYCARKTKSSFHTPEALWPVSPQITST